MNSSKLTVLLGRVGLSIITFCATLTLAVAWMVTEFPHALDGTDVIELAKVPNYFRNLFEILSFASAAITVPAVALWAIYFSRKQAEEARKSREEAENARRSSIYMDIVERWNSKEQVCARMRVLSIVDSARRDWNSNESLRQSMPVRREYEKEYFSKHLAEIKRQRKVLRLRGYTVVLQFIEDIGSLCRKKYISAGDIFDLLGSSIDFQIETFEKYISEARKPPGSTSTYANVIYLHRIYINEFRHLNYTELSWPIKEAP